MSEFLDRVAQVNAADAYAYRVRAVVVFGSFLTGRDMIGDIDLAVQSIPRFDDRAKQDEVEEEARSRKDGPFRNLTENVCWPQIEMERALRARSTALELHPIGNLEAILRRAADTPYKVLFGSWSPPAVA